MINDIQLSWMAGIFDQKANIQRKKNKTRATPQMVLYVESRHIEVIRKLGELTGTSTEISPPQRIKEWDRRACAEHCQNQFHVHVPTVHEDKDLIMPSVAHWQATGAGAAVILHNVMPYMKTDRGFKEFYWEALNYTVTGGQGFAAIYRSLTRLRGLGWLLPGQYETFFKDVS